MVRVRAGGWLLAAGCRLAGGGFRGTMMIPSFATSKQVLPWYLRCTFKVSICLPPPPSKDDSEVYLYLAEPKSSVCAVADNLQPTAYSLQRQLTATAYSNSLQQPTPTAYSDSVPPSRYDTYIYSPPLWTTITISPPHPSPHRTIAPSHPLTTWCASGCRSWNLESGP